MAEIIEKDLVPKEWGMVPLSTFVLDYKGGAALTPSDFTDHGFEVIPKKAIGYGGKLALSRRNATYCSVGFASNNPGSVVDSDYLITTLRDLVPTGPSIGLIVQFSDEKHLLLAQGVYGFRLKSGLDRGFLVALSNSPEFRRTMQRIAVGSTQIHIRTNDYFEVRIPLPPLEEQRKIADILSTWDEAIEQQTRLLELKRERKRGLMQHLLTGKVRFKEFEGLEWETKRLGDIAYVDRRSLSNATEPTFTFKYISLSDVENGRVANTAKTLSFGKAPFRARKLLQDNDVLMATVRPNLKGFAIIRSKATEYIASTGFAIITAKAGTSAEYIFQSLFSLPIEQQVNALVAGSNYPAISSSDVKSLEIACPPFLEQQKIASVLSAADTELETLQTQLSALRSQKRGLMQRLLTGKTRVKLGDEVIVR